jgi:hypothetical protein
MAGAKITIFLPNGNAQSLRIAELSNWTGKAVASPRTELEALLARDEVSQAGIYFLVGTDPEDGNPMAYIGEGEDVGKRLRQHRDKEFWVQVIVFVSKDENLTKAHIRYLEGRLIEEAGKVGRYELFNDQTSGAKLPEADREDMEVFLERVRQLLPLLGCDLLVPVVQTSKGKNGGDLLCTIKGLVAHGQRTPNGFVVLKGSEASPLLRPSAQERAAWIISLREKLLKTQILLVEEDRLRFAQDYEFSSPSAAAAIIHGGHANGLTAWKSSEGRTLKELEAEV